MGHRYVRAVAQWTDVDPASSRLQQPMDRADEVSKVRWNEVYEPWCHNRVEGFGIEWGFEAVRDEELKSPVIDPAIRCTELPSLDDVCDFVDLRVGLVNRHGSATNHCVRDREKKRFNVQHDRQRAGIPPMQIVSEPARSSSQHQRPAK